MAEPYPVTDPFEGGSLAVGDGHLVWWEAAGNPDGKPAVILHGGPGAPLGSRARRMFDPDRYLVVQFDQRQCGRSSPHVADMEVLRRHLGLDRWRRQGGSWDTTLALVDAETHPERVTEMVLAAARCARTARCARLQG